MSSDDSMLSALQDAPGAAADAQALRGPAGFFRSERPVRPVAVHSDPRSVPRCRALADLEAGRVDVVFSVDMFTEGVDVPHFDTVLLARPTESPIVFVQGGAAGSVAPIPRPPCKSSN